MDHRRGFQVLFASLIFLIGGLPLWCQQTVPSPANAAHSIGVTTEMVRVPAIVTNASGAPVSDLTVHDFAILENGRPQQIAYFEHIQTKPELFKPTEPAANEVSNTYERTPRRLTIVLLDMLNTSFVDQERARRSIFKFLSQSMVATEPVALMTLNTSGIKVIHDFTTKPDVLAEALKEAGGQQSLNETQSHAHVDITRGREDAEKEAGGERPLNEILSPPQIGIYRARGNPMEEAALLREVEARHDFTRTYGVFGVGLTLASLRELGEAFAGIPGRKSLIWATGGLPFPADDNTYMTRWLNGMSELYRDTWQALNRADIAVYPLDVEGLVNRYYHNPMYSGRVYASGYFRSTVYDMEEFAKMTGGRMCYVKTEISGCFREAAADSGDYYLLGFYPGPDPKRNGWRKLTVVVERSDAKVLARTRYYVGETRDANSGRRDDIQLGLTSPLDYTDLPLTVRWTGNMEDAGKKTVGFQFRLGQGAATVDEGSGNHVSIDFAAMALSQQGKIVGQFSRQMEGNLQPAQAEKLKAGSAFFPGELELAPGEYMVRFVMRDNLSGRMGSISTSFKVP